MKFVVTLAAGLMISLNLGVGKELNRPNLLFVFSDQQSWDTLGCYGDKAAKTPHLDQLAQDAVVFNYCISSNPVCTPYRGMLLSGQYSLKNGAYTNDKQMKPGSGNYFAEVLNAHGYRSAYIGKWHLYGGMRNRPIPPGPYRYGFDDVFYSNNCTVSFKPTSTFYWNEKGEKVFFNKYEPDGQTDQAVAYIEAQVDKPGPWDLFVSWHPPHNPHNHVPKEWSEKFDPQKLPLRPGMEDNRAVRKDYADYCGMVANLDWNFGRLIEALKKTGQYDNTLIVFTSDHGETFGAADKSWHRASHKRRPEDVSCRVPLLIHRPGQKEGGRTPLLIGSLDLMPTILGLLQIKAPDTCDGRNLSEAILQNRTQMTADDAIPLWNEEMKWRGLFTQRYTFSVGTFNSLFDRENDPAQLHNVYNDPSYINVRQEFHARTLAWMKLIGDTFDVNTVPSPGKSAHPYQFQDPSQPDAKE